MPQDWFRPDVFLRDDLAMSARDVTELAVEMERTTGVRLAEAAIDGAATYGDLVDRIVDARADDGAATVPRVFVRASLTPARRHSRGVLLRSTWLSPYAIETLRADARRAGPGAHLDLVLPASASLAVIEKIERCFECLASAGVTVRLHVDAPRLRLGPKSARTASDREHTASAAVARLAATPLIRHR
jgi:hypothetical protein